MTHRWRFFRAGGVDQAQITTGADLVHIDELDKKLWVALACPIKGTEFDRRTLELIDGDGDGRVRADELIRAAHWARDALADVEQLARRGDGLPLAAIDTGKPLGASLHATARQLLQSLGKPDAKVLDFADLKDGITKFDHERFNGDGFLPPTSAGADEAAATLIKDILACTADAPNDRSGAPGVTRDAAKAFFDQVAAHVAWLDAGQDATVLPLGDATAGAFAAFDKVRAKVDDYFGRVRVAAYDTRALDAVNREESEYLAIAAKDLHISAEEVLHFPLARVTGDQPLPLAKGVNPAWTEAIAAFRDQIIKPLFGETDALTADGWSMITTKLGPYAAWRDAKAGGAVEGLGEARVRELLASPSRESLDVLFAQEDAAKPLADAIEGVERLCRYDRDLLDLANNFVCFRDFYARRNPSMFQVGRLYIDRRSCDLCIAVNDAGRHAAMAPNSNFYVLYCDLKNAKGETRSVAATVTNGDLDNLMVGRNGVFYDRDGNDWDATITKIVDNPVSVRQAFWRPYKKVVRAIEASAARRAQEAEERSSARMDAAAGSADAAASGKVAPPPEAPKKLDIGVVAAIGVAVGGITAALGLLMQAFFGLGIWMPVGLLALILLISGPSMAIAWLKLRTRNLGPLLDANGWAVGAMARVNVKLGASLTAVATLPKDAECDLVDPFADKRRPWWLYWTLIIVLGLGISWYLGKLDGCLPEAARSTEVLGSAAPASVVEKAKTDAAAAEGEGEIKEGDPAE